MGDEPGPSLPEPAANPEPRAGPSRSALNLSGEPEPRIVNLAPNEDISRAGWVPPLRIYLGNQLYAETKEFRKSLYIGFYKTDPQSGDIKNRFNFPMAQLEKVEEAFKVIKAHVLDHP